MTVESNLITGGGQGVDAGTSSTVQISDVTIRGNKLVGQFGEDAIHTNRYHDSDGDGYGLLVEGNEITNVREDGNHNDCFQSVWVGDHLVFRRNYLHDNACQGFFVKDQATAIDSVVADDNLIIRNAAGCIPASRCSGFTVSPFQVYGPITSFVMSRNTIWTPELAPATTLRGSGWGRVDVNDNVIHRAWTDARRRCDAGTRGRRDDLACTREGPWPATGFATSCSPPFPDAAGGDYRLPGRRGRLGGRRPALRTLKGVVPRRGHASVRETRYLARSVHSRQLRHRGCAAHEVLPPLRLPAPEAEIGGTLAARCIASSGTWSNGGWSCPVHLRPCRAGGGAGGRRSRSGP